VVCVASLAPLTDGFDWYAGMVSDEALRAATQGREARAHFAATEEFDPNIFTPADWAALKAPWAALGADAEKAGAAGPEGLIDDDVAFTSPWGFDLAQIDAPVLLVQGGEDRIVPAAHAQWLLSGIQSSELWLRPLDGHISVLNAIPVAMDWLRDRDELLRAGGADR
jgi:pimeloyl-ACP methyl ester carboxylesterase